MAGIVGRLHPLVRAISIAWDLWDYAGFPVPWGTPNRLPIGWEATLNCTAPKSPPFGATGTWSICNVNNAMTWAHYNQTEPWASDGLYWVTKFLGGDNYVSPSPPNYAQGRRALQIRWLKSQGTPTYPFSPTLPMWEFADAPHPWWNPGEQPIQRPAADPSPKPLFGPTVPDLAPMPHPQTRTQPARGGTTARYDVAVTISDRQPPKLNVRPARRPRPYPNERKFQGPAGAARLGYVLAVAAFDTVTEVQDFVEALYKALPSDIRADYGSKPTLPQMVGAIWNNAGELNATEAVSNLLENAVEDFIIGGSQGAAGKGLDSPAARRGLTATWGPVLEAGFSF